MGCAVSTPTPLLSSPPEFLAFDPHPYHSSPTMSNVANEKGSIDYSGPGGNAASALPAHTYVHNTAPQLRVIGNPGPL